MFLKPERLFRVIIQWLGIWATRSGPVELQAWLATLTHQYHHRIITCLTPPQSWSASHFVLASPYTSFADNNLQPVQGHPPVHSGYGNQYPYQYLPAQPGDRLMRLGSSATKEARKKRMARQRRFLSHHRNHNQQNVQANQHHQNQSSDHHARLGNDNVAPTTEPNPGNWVYWPASGAVSTTPVMSMDVQPVHTSDRPAMQSHQSHHQRQVASDRRQVGYFDLVIFLFGIFSF